MCPVNLTNSAWGVVHLKKNPSQLCLASEEVQSAALQLWDLSYGVSPMELLTGHTRLRKTGLVLF